MDRDAKFALLRVSLASTLEGVNPDYLLRWLSELPEGHVFGSVEQLVVDLLGCADPAHDYDPDTDWLIAQEIWRDVQPEIDPEVHVVDGQVVAHDLNSIEVIRAPIPEWILRLDSLIGFLTDSHGHPPTAGELRRFLVAVWLPRFS